MNVDTRGRHVVVIGGGIAGLAAAHRLLASGVRVTLLEATGRVGGKLQSGEIEGVRVDLGAESMLARRPEGTGLARAVGLGDRLEPPATATSAVWTRDALRPMPKGHVMGVPGDASALAGLLSAEGLARIEHEKDLAPTAVGDDVAVGAYVAERLGREVVDRLVVSTQVTPTASRCARPSPSSSRRRGPMTRCSKECGTSRRGRPGSRRAGRSSWVSTAASAPCRAPSPTPYAPRAATSAPRRPSSA
jgi:hypothetical protein